VRHPYLPGAGRVLKDAETHTQRRPRHTQVLEKGDSETRHICQEQDVCSRRQRHILEGDRGTYRNSRRDILRHTYLP